MINKFLFFLILISQIGNSQKINDSIYKIDNKFIDLKYNYLEWDLLKRQDQSLTDYPLMFRKSNNVEKIENELFFEYQLDYYILFPEDKKYSIEYLIDDLEIHKNLLVNKSIFKYEINNNPLLMNTIIEDEDDNFISFEENENVNRLISLNLSTKDNINLKTESYLTKSNKLYEYFGIPFTEYEIIFFIYTRNDKILYVEKEVKRFYRVIENLDFLKNFFKEINQIENSEGLFKLDKNNNYFKNNNIDSLESLENWYNKLIEIKFDENISNVIEKGELEFKKFKSNVEFKIK